MYFVVLIFIFKACGLIVRAVRRSRSRAGDSPPVQITAHSVDAERVRERRRLRKKLQSVADRMEKYKALNSDTDGWTDRLAWRSLEYDKEKIIEQLEALEYEKYTRS